MSRHHSFDTVAGELGHDFTGPIRKGGDYVPVLRHGAQAFVSGQVPRVGDEVVVVGRAGEDVSLERARHAAKVCIMRALVLLREEMGSLDHIRQVLRMSVYVQCAATFTEQSEVADAASEVLHRVLGDSGRHTRTSVGVFQLPKNATVEIDLVVAVD